MYYKIVKSFGPQKRDEWQNYLAWRGLKLTRFDSVDGILRPDLFEPRTEEDWRHCITEDYKTSLITNLDYARSILNRYDDPILFGVEIELEEGYVPKEGLLGFDIIDGCCDVSLVTDWGRDEDGIINAYVLGNGLIGDLDRALEIRNLLRTKYPDDSHAGDCEVWAIYRIDL